MRITPLTIATLLSLIIALLLLPIMTVLFTTKPVQAGWPGTDFKLTVHVSPTSSGSVEIDQIPAYSYPATSTFNNGESVSLQAVPAPGYSFDHWSGDLSGNTNPTTINIDCDKTVVANFSQPERTWLLVCSITAAGIVIGVIIWLALRARTAWYGLAVICRNDCTIRQKVKGPNHRLSRCWPSLFICNISFVVL